MEEYNKFAITESEYASDANGSVTGNFYFTLEILVIFLWLLRDFLRLSYLFTFDKMNCILSDLKVKSQERQARSR